jgi:DNA polymerase III, delta subunit
MTPYEVRAALAGELPPATLVLGPGAWDVVDGPGGLGADIHHRSLTAELARDVCAVAAWMPTGDRTVITLNLGGASAQVQNMLLKVLEEPPESTRFVLAAESRPLPTIVSRCRVLVLGREAEAEPADARDKAAVTTALRAARSGQAPLLAQALRTWVPAQAALLATWAAEAVSGQWAVFGPGTAPGVSAEQAMRLLTELARYRGAKLGTMAALEAVFSPG